MTSNVNNITSSIIFALPRGKDQHESCSLYAAKWESYESAEVGIRIKHDDEKQDKGSKVCELIGPGARGYVSISYRHFTWLGTLPYHTDHAILDGQELEQHGKTNRALV